MGMSDSRLIPNRIVTGTRALSFRQSASEVVGCIRKELSGFEQIASLPKAGKQGHVMNFGKRLGQLSPKRSSVRKLLTTVEHPIASANVLIAAHSWHQIAKRNRQASH